MSGGTIQVPTTTSGGGGGGGAVTIADGADVNAGSTTDAAIVSDANGTLSGKLRGLVKWAFERMPASLGQKLMAASFPVVIASDQSPVTVATTQTTVTGTLGALNDVVTIAIDSHVGVGAVLAAAPATLTLVPEISFDGGTTWVATSFIVPNTGNSGPSLSFGGTSTVLRTIACWPGTTHARVRVSVYTSGSVSVTLQTSDSIVIPPATTLDGGTNTNQNVGITPIAGLDFATSQHKEALGYTTRPTAGRFALAVRPYQASDGTNDTPIMDADARRGFQEISRWLGSTAPTVGQKTMAASVPVVLPSDQTVNVQMAAGSVDVNPIVGQAGVDGGDGPVTAATQRIVLANDTPNIVTTRGTTTPGAPGTVTVTTSSATIVAANANRRGLLITNVGSGRVALSFNGAALLDRGIVLYPGGTFEMDEFTWMTGAVQAIASVNSDCALQENS